MSRATPSPQYGCTECGATRPKWSGRCDACGEWNTLVESVSRPTSAPAPRSRGPVRLREVDPAVSRPRATGIDELDRVLGGGLVPGSVTLLGGEPGVGKSTLLLQLLAGWAGPTLYISAEESGQQVRLRAERLGADRPELWILAEIDLPAITAAIDQVRPELVVVDSIQSVADPSVASPPGSVAQVRACAHHLVAEAKRRGVPVVLVGHVTKEGGLAGPRALEHVVDTVLALEGERHHALRLLRATKHRFGATGELGLFEMVGDGMAGVPDASRLFLADRRAGVAGSTVLPTMEGHRPLVVEVQALTTPVPTGASGRRTAQGLDGGRLAMLLAVVERRVGIPVGGHDVYASTVGGVRVVEPALDLALCAAVVSAVTGQPMPADLAVFGEVGLAGEVRQVPHATRRLAEAARLGFSRAIVPANTPAGDQGIEVRRASSITEALAQADLFENGGAASGLRAV
ncbi:MAG: DNA repair protein RadA [Ilumatobacteraceae bacterium]